MNHVLVSYRDHRIFFTSLECQIFYRHPFYIIAM